MEQLYQISRHCRMDTQGVYRNGEQISVEASPDFASFSKSLYYSLGTSYPKFFKMDNLSKLAWLGAELLLKDEQTTNIAIVLSNRHSSLDTDLKHLATISDNEQYYPSPAIFVYTLPNVCIGEIAIRHNLQTENIFFVSEQFDSQLAVNYSNYLLNTKRAEKVLCGWVDYLQENYKLVLYLVEKTGILAHNLDVVRQLTR
ncbi:MAG: hypothetical protein LBV59_06345 [Sphingobacterium sp.]|jgi:hypothetical protein|uniref:hypothetical protein n=1 Tax=unclassified Sphingobacterium TaxID=2609468 RepID=UPI00283BCA17|nr:hypothetical protein [Sphingobacterium sp.]MDR3007536.1 hypothetical protein [Sphingobacterium sp.]